MAPRFQSRSEAKSVSTKVEFAITALDVLVTGM
jgi:hypothetical protein